MACPFCGSVKSKPLSPYVWKCEDCGKEYLVAKAQTS